MFFSGAKGLARCIGARITDFNLDGNKVSTMQVILDQDSFYSWFNQAFLFDSNSMLGVWVSESEMCRLADTMAPQRYPCLAMMIPGSPMSTLRGPFIFIVSR